MSDVRDQRRISPRPPKKAAASRPPRDGSLTATTAYIPRRSRAADTGDDALGRCDRGPRGGCVALAGLQP